MTNRTGLFAAGWAALYGTLALGWTLTGPGFPYGVNDPDRDMNLLRNVPADVGAPSFAALLLATAVAAFAMTGDHAVRLRGAPRTVLLSAGWLVVALLVVVVPDTQVLTLLGYAPMLILGAPFGWPDVSYGDIFTWSLINKVVAMAGGVLLARTLLCWQLRTRPGPGIPAWATASSAARWGRWASYLAAAVPVSYAVTRFTWALRIPVGVDEAFLDELWDSGAVWAGVGLGAFAVVGAVLTLGLTRRWGEVFPRWMVGLSGRPVPVRLAVVPATVVALAVMSTSLSMFSSPEFARALGDGVGAAVAPMLLWPLWSGALGAATLAYYLRRRGPGFLAGNTQRTSLVDQIPGR
jgi:hypothetical protein